MAKTRTTDAELARANEKSRKRKEARDKMLADKTVEKGLLIVHTGKGKGKSTAAFGLVARAIGNGMKIGVVQYVKGKWETGERQVLEHFPDQVTIRTMGEGFTWETQDRVRDEELVKGAWEVAKSFINDESYKLIILDEINIAIKLGYISSKEILTHINSIDNRKNHIVLTGRGASESIINQADLVTEMKLIKHPFKEQGIKAQKCVEY